MCGGATMKCRYYTFSLIVALLFLCSCVLNGFNGFVYAEEGQPDAVETSSVTAMAALNDGSAAASDEGEAPTAASDEGEAPAAATVSDGGEAAAVNDGPAAAVSDGGEAPAAVGDGPAANDGSAAASAGGDAPAAAADTPGSNSIAACESAAITAEDTPATTNAGGVAPATATTMSETPVAAVAVSSTPAVAVSSTPAAAVVNKTPTTPAASSESMTTPTETSEPVTAPTETSESITIPTETNGHATAPTETNRHATAPIAVSDPTKAPASKEHFSSFSPADASGQKSASDSGTLKIASAAGGTFSVVLSNQVYGYAGSSDDGNLSATFDLSFLSDELTSAPEGWTDPSGQGFYQSSFSLANMGRTTRGGIPSSSWVIIESTPSSSNPGAAYGQSFTTSYIVNGQYLAAPPQMLNEDGSAPDLSEFSLMRFANQPGDRKYLYVINDSEDPLTLSIDVKNYSCSFLYPVHSGKGPETILRDIPKTITLQPGEYGYLSLTDNSDLPAGARLSDTQPSLTPLDVNVLAGISSVGAFDDAHSIWSLPSGSALGDGAYALFRVEKRKTDTDNPKTDDSEDPNPGEENEKTPDDPAPPEETKETPDNPAPPAQTEKTPDNPAPPAQTEKTPDNPAPPAQTEKTPDNPASPTDIQKQQEPTSSTTPAPKKKQKKSKNTAQQNPVSEHTAVTRRTASSETPGDHADPVNTADHAPIEWYLTLMLAAGAAMLVLSLSLRRRRDR